jgi:hypothetical protein
MHTNPWLGALLLIATCAACGGKSAIDGSQQTSAGGGSPAAGGQGDTPDPTSNGGANAQGGAEPISRECPTAPPSAGTSCDYQGDACHYALDMCSSIQFECASGQWQAVPQADGASLTCFNYGPDQLGIPKDGDSCACRGALDCTFDDCGAAGKVHAVCDNTVWHVTSEPCADQPCGPSGLTCPVGEACVVPGGLSATGPQYTCRPDPCAEQSETTSCECAGSLCGPFELCSIVNDVVKCECPNC